MQVSITCAISFSLATQGNFGLCINPINLSTARCLEFLLSGISVLPFGYDPIYSPFAPFAILCISSMAKDTAARVPGRPHRQSAAGDIFWPEPGNPCVIVLLLLGGE